MAQVRRMRRKLQRGLCPYDDTIALLKGGLQSTPKWLNSVRKYPPSKMHLTPGKIPRPSEFWNDRIQRVILRNRRRPSWIPSLPAAKGHPQVANVMAGIQFNDAFAMPSHASEPDVEFAACQAWFMTKKGMSEDEAYEQARFRMRDLIKQKERVWEVYRRKQLLQGDKGMERDRFGRIRRGGRDGKGSNSNNNNNLGRKRYMDERINLTQSWIDSVNKKMKDKMYENFSHMQNIHESTMNNPNIPNLIPIHPEDEKAQLQGQRQGQGEEQLTEKGNDSSTARLDNIVSQKMGEEEQSSFDKFLNVDPNKLNDNDNERASLGKIKIDTKNPFANMIKEAEKDFGKTDSLYSGNNTNTNTSTTSSNTGNTTEKNRKMSDNLKETVNESVDADSKKNIENDTDFVNATRIVSAGEERRDVEGESRKKYGAMTDEELEFEKIRLFEEEKKFNKDWQTKIKLLRFIEYTDYIAKNPHLGLSDPTELLLGLPKTTDKQKEINKRLLTKMSQKQNHLKYLKK